MENTSVEESQTVGPASDRITHAPAPLSGPEPMKPGTVPDAVEPQTPDSVPSADEPREPVTVPDAVAPAA